MTTKTWSTGRSVLFTAVAIASAILVDQIVGCMSAPAQQKTSIAAAVGNNLPATVDDLVRQMANAAAVIFVGEVVQVRRPAGYAGSPQDAAEGIVEIDFRVDRDVKGSQVNGIYTLREWAGSWAGGLDRYRSGQRFLMLLRAPGTSGFSSPVHGSEGAIPLRGASSAPGADDVSSATAQWMVDIRWLQAQTLRTQVRLPTPLRGPVPTRGTTNPHSEVSTISGGETEPLLIHALPGPWLEIGVPDPQVEPLAHVLDLCAAKVVP